ncbi:MAG: hypothetical protein WC803_09540 [Sphingomonas sp.]|jgi:hypothetical protein
MTIVSSSSFRPVKAEGTVVGGAPLLNPDGPKTVLGWSHENLVAPLSPDAATMFGPRGVCLHPNGALWVADTGHHRILGWRTVPEQDNQPADIVIGQDGFCREGRNGKGEISAATLNVPTGICAFGTGLAVADAWNHRVLIWQDMPTHSGQPADIVLGQADEYCGLANRGSDKPTAASLHWPYGIAEIAGGLLVCDSGNRRVLLWRNPRATGQPADLVLGQTDFTCRDENSGEEVSAMSMRWPHGATWWNGYLAISDSGNNRVMLWRGLPIDNGAPCDVVLGQEDMARCDHNISSYYPSARSLNMPYAAVAAEGRLVVADTANSRLLGWDVAQTGAGAASLSCQPDFASKGDNRWGMAMRDSVCWPYGLSARGGLIAIADSGNNRVLLWPLAR